MPYARSTLAEFETANPLYVGASVAFYTVDVNGVKTATLADLYAAPIGSDLLPNPQTLDSFGKVAVPIYIQDPVIGTITTPNSSVPAHDTGIIANIGRVRAAYATATLYYPNDLIQDPATGYIYSATASFISSSLGVDISAGRLALWLTPADLMAAINAQTQATNAAASASAASTSATAASTSATASGTSATAASSSASSASSSATNASSSATAAASSATTAAAAAASATGGPQGRLSLISAQAVMASDNINVATIYYVPYRGQSVPIYDGSQLVNRSIGSQITLALDNNIGHVGFHQLGKLFDLFCYSNAGVATLCSGPAWTSTTSRGAGVGTSELASLNGILVNANAITAKVDTSSSTVSIPAQRTTYLGTFYATANGQTGMQFRPSAVSGGSANILGLYNAYNRIATSSAEGDSTASWAYGTATWRPSNNSANNRISFVDGLQQSALTVEFMQSVTGGGSLTIGVSLDSSTAVPDHVAAVNSAINVPITVAESFLPVLGLHSVYAMEWASISSTFFGGSMMNLRARLEM